MKRTILLNNWGCNKLFTEFNILFQERNLMLNMGGGIITDKPRVGKHVTVVISHKEPTYIIKTNQTTPTEKTHNLIINSGALQQMLKKLGMTGPHPLFFHPGNDGSGLL
jgi:hypothetical protein